MFLSIVFVGLMYTALSPPGVALAAPDRADIRGWYEGYLRGQPMATELADYLSKFYARVPRSSGGLIPRRRGGVGRWRGRARARYLAHKQTLASLGLEPERPSRFVVVPDEQIQRWESSSEAPGDLVRFPGGLQALQGYLGRNKGDCDLVRAASEAAPDIRAKRWVCDALGVVRPQRGPLVGTVDHVEEVVPEIVIVPEPQERIVPTSLMLNGTRKIGFPVQLNITGLAVPPRASAGAPGGDPRLLRASRTTTEVDQEDHTTTMPPYVLKYMKAFLTNEPGQWESLVAERRSMADLARLAAEWNVSGRAEGDPFVFAVVPEIVGWAAPATEAQGSRNADNVLSAGSEKSLGKSIVLGLWEPRLPHFEPFQALGYMSYGHGRLGRFVVWLMRKKGYITGNAQGFYDAQRDTYFLSDTSVGKLRFGPVDQM